MNDDLKSEVPSEGSNTQAQSAEPASEPETSPDSSAARRSRPAVYAWISIAILAIIVIVWAFMDLQRAQERTNAARTRLAQGQAALVDGDLDMALYQFMVALELDPSLPGAHSSLGEIALARGRGAEAGRHFEAELEANPGDRRSHLALGCLYALGSIEEGDPHTLRGYLLDRFSDVLAVEWSEQLEFSAPECTDAFAQSVYHFQYAAERLPADPAPTIGLALAHLATYDLGSARERLTRLTTGEADETTLLVVRDLINDINSEEEYQYMIAYRPAWSEIPPSGDELPIPAPPADLEAALEPLPPMDSIPSADRPVAETPPALEETSSETQDGGFGHRGTQPFEGSADSQLSLRLTPEDLFAQPTVKPVSNDIFLDESNEWVHTMRIANIREEGSVGFREGETIVMPNTNVEVHVVEAADDKVVLEEGGNLFTWIPGDVGWMLDPSVHPQAYASAIPPGVKVHFPDEETEEESDAPGSEQELGPEVPAENQG